MSVQITTSEPKEEESGLISLETLESLQKEVILKLVDLWRSYAEDRRGKAKKFRLGIELLDRIGNAIRLNPDLTELDQIREVWEEVKREHEIWKKRRLVPEVNPV